MHPSVRVSVLSVCISTTRPLPNPRTPTPPEPILQARASVYLWQEPMPSTLTVHLSVRLFAPPFQSIPVIQVQQRCVVWHLPPLFFVSFLLLSLHLARISLVSLIGFLLSFSFSFHMSHTHSLSLTLAHFLPHSPTLFSFSRSLPLCVSLQSPVCVRM